MTILVVGARGVLGRRAVAALRDGGHDVRTAGRSQADVVIDLASGAGVDESVRSIDAVIHCATDPRRHREVDRDGTAKLLAAAVDVPVVYPSIVGCDVIPLRYYRSKMAAEEMVLSHRAGGTVIRATQFHQLVWSTLERLARSPVLVVPHDTRFQVLDPAVLADALVRAVEQRVVGRTDDVGGAFAYGSKELAHSYLAASGRRRPVLALNVPGLTGAAFRAGGNLTPNRSSTGETWNDFVRRRTEPA